MFLPLPKIPTKGQPIDQQHLLSPTMRHPLHHLPHIMLIIIKFDHLLLLIPLLHLDRLHRITLLLLQKRLLATTQQGQTPLQPRQLLNQPIGRLLLLLLPQLLPTLRQTLICSTHLDDAAFEEVHDTLRVLVDDGEEFEAFVRVFLADLDGDLVGDGELALVGEFARAEDLVAGHVHEFLFELGEIRGYVFEVVGGLVGGAAGTQDLLDEAVGGVVVQAAVLADKEPVDREGFLAELVALFVYCSRALV